MAKPPKALLERAVKATQVYCGSAGVGIRIEQRLYARMHTTIQKVADKAGVDFQTAHDQILAEAKRRGCRAVPAKDY